MSWASIIILFFLGLSIGSFLNVVILRYQSENHVFDLKKISGRSHCLSCGQVLKWFDLIPIFSFFLQKGRCRYCHQKISFQYPLGEILGGLILAGLPYFFKKFYIFYPSYFSLGMSFLWIFVFLIWLLIFFIDLRLMIIPNELNRLLIFLGLAIIFLQILGKKIINFTFPQFSFLKEYSLMFSFFKEDPLINHLFGALIGFLIFGFLFLISQGKAMGLGDVKLVFSSGLILGWPDIGLSIILAFILGGLIGGFLLLTKKKKWKEEIPFGPILILGFVLTIFFGSQILGFYFKLFSF